MAQFEQCSPRGALVCATVLLASGFGLAGSAHAGALTFGPVEQVNPKSSTLVVLGQTYHLGVSARVVDRATGAFRTLSSITPGTLVAIDGTESISGAVNVQDVAPLPQLNVPGATQLVVTGVVSAVSSVGQIRIGKLSVDINATLTSDSQAFAVGQVVKVVGTQPVSNGIFLAQSASLGIAGSGASADGIAGSGTTSQGIAGSGATSLGIAGSGTSAQGIAGSGTSAQGIAGSGASSLGIAGSGSKGIAGSGTSAQGIAGSGASSLGIAGSGSKGIAGSGTSAQGIAGSGATALGIAGSGLN